MVPWGCRLQLSARLGQLPAFSTSWQSCPELGNMARLCIHASFIALPTQQLSSGNSLGETTSLLPQVLGQSGGGGGHATRAGKRAEYWHSLQTIKISAFVSAPPQFLWLSKYTQANAKWSRPTAVGPHRVSPPHTLSSGDIKMLSTLLVYFFIWWFSFQTCNLPMKCIVKSLELFAWK